MNTDKLIETLSGIFDLTSIVIILTLSFALTATCLWLIKRDTKKYKSFRDTLSNGTKVFANTPQTGFDGVVTNVDDEYVTIETKIRKHRVYPIKNK